MVCKKPSLSSSISSTTTKNPRFEEFVVMIWSLKVAVMADCDDDHTDWDGCRKRDITVVVEYDGGDAMRRRREAKEGAMVVLPKPWRRRSTTVAEALMATA
ncbi:hypothetical protein LOK49_LG08G01930 [Camellia lanceoleosa]|uniref:Uncharacterized protein n=1 Tax=Camellia lanceoleosa TaxID=1840588 RepID=A0ACC0GNN5_9ERIC|nr:hypothetical protein LOK49_LG08G01930 [Camellia lanceoleosa]